MSKNDPARLKRGRVLIIDDDEGITTLLWDSLARIGINLSVAHTAQEGLAAIRSAIPDLVLLDLTLPDSSDFSFLEKIITENPSTEVVVLTGDHSLQSTVSTVRRGALDYVTKPFDPARLAEQIENWLAPRDSGRTRSSTTGLDYAASVGIIGKSKALTKLAGKVVRIGPHFRNALITGPTGSGKEMVARFLHKMSGSSGKFIVFNCGAVPETLFESELFGHVKGAFTGAIHDRAGIAEQADGGTLFIDEAGELALPMQAALLRLVQNRESKRLGTTAVRHLKLRIIAATGRDLQKMVENRLFREDLYHRLSTVEISVPALRERKDDIPLLTDHFLAAICARYQKPLKTLCPAASEVLAAYSWPGNVRELESVVDYCCLMCPSDVIEKTDLPEFVHQNEGKETLSSLREMEQRHLENILRLTGGNREEAAEALGIGRATLYRMIADQKKKQK